MKWFVLLVVVALCYAGYRLHVDRLSDTEEKTSKADAERAKNMVAVSNALDGLVQRVSSPLDLREKEDFLPVIQAAKQRVAARRATADPIRREIFERALALLNYMTPLADERSKSIKSMLRNRAAKSTALSSVDSSDFFNKSVTKRWDETLNHARPALYQLLEQLRTREQACNTQAGGTPQGFDLGNSAPVMIRPESLTEGSSTLQKEYTPSAPAGPKTEGATMIGGRKPPGQ